MLLHLTLAERRIFFSYLCDGKLTVDRNRGTDEPRSVRPLVFKADCRFVLEKFIFSPQRHWCVLGLCVFFVKSYETAFFVNVWVCVFCAFVREKRKEREKERKKERKRERERERKKEREREREREHAIAMCVCEFASE